MPDRVQVGPCSHSATAGVRAWAGVCKSRRMYVRAYVRRWFIVGQRLSSRFSGSFLRWFCVRRAGRRVAGDVRSRVVRPVVRLSASLCIQLSLFPNDASVPSKPGTPLLPRSPLAVNLRAAASFCRTTGFRMRRQDCTRVSPTLHVATTVRPLCRKCLDFALRYRSLVE